jgi:hypothetical protein
MPAKKIAKRYTEEKKAEILDFIEKYNAEHGRGGQTVAVKKFGTTTLSINAWSKKLGKNTKKPTKKVKKFKNPSKLIERLKIVTSEIAKAEKSLAKYQSEAKELRKEIRAAIE